jgi:hypothetical protein
MSDLLSRSRRLNAALGGGPAESFCGRLWRWRPLTLPLVLPLDLAFYILQGGHCRECAELDARESAARPGLDELIEASKRRVATMAPEEREAELRAQRESWVRGEMGIGLDRDEAEFRRGRA